MAQGNGAKKMEEDLQAFNNDNLAGLDIDQNPEDILIAAEKVGIITQETHSKIINTLKDHAAIFEANVNPDGVTFVNQEALRSARRRAFMITYGKFIAEQRIQEFEDENGSVMKVLNKTLGNDLKGIDGNSPYDKRSELQVALAKLAAFRKDATGQYASPVAKRLQTEIDSEKAAKQGEKSIVTPKILSLRSEKTRLEAERTQAEVASRKAGESVSKAVRKLEEYSNWESIFADRYFRRFKYDDEVTKLGAMVANNIDQRKVQSKLEEFKKRAETLKYVPGFSDVCNQFIDAFEDLGSGATNDELRKIVNNELVALLVAIRDNVPQIDPAERAKRERAKAKAENHKKDCDKKLTNVSDELVKVNKDLVGLEQKDKDLDAEISGLDKKTVIDKILEKAFPGLKISNGIVKISGFETNFKHVKAQMKGASDYFGSPEGVPTMRDNHGELRSLYTKVSSSEIDQLMTELRVDRNKPLKAQLQKLKAASSAKSGNMARNPSGNELTRYKAAKKSENTSWTDQQAQDAVFADFDEIRERQGEELAKVDSLRETFEELLKQSEVLYGDMKKLVKHLEIANKAGVVLKKSDGSEIDLAQAITVFGEINVKARDFNPKALLEFYDVFDGFFDQDTNLAKVIDDLDEAGKRIGDNRELQDPEAAKRILMAIAAEQNPALSLDDRQKVVDMTMMEDVGILQNEESYESLSKRASAKVLDAAAVVEFKEKLIGFKYKNGEKVIEPFKGLKPDNFASWKNLEELFTKGWTDSDTGKFRKLNTKNEFGRFDGFFILAALEKFEGEGDKSLQRRKLENKLKELIAKELNVDEKLKVSGYRRVVDKAFQEQLEDARVDMESHFTYFDANKAELKKNRIEELKTKKATLEEKNRRGDLSDTQFEIDLEKLKKEAANDNVENDAGFAEDSILNDFKHTDFGKWVDDRTYDAGQYLKNKATSVGESALDLAGKGIAGTAKVGLNIAGKGVLLPFTIAKRAAMIGARPVIGFANLFKKTPWQPYSLRQTFKNDVKGVFDYVGGLAKDTVEGAKTNIKTVPAEKWKAVEFKKHEYKDRTKIKIEDLEAKAKNFEEKARFTPIESESRQAFDWEKYRKEVAQVDEFLKTKAA